MNLTPGDIVAKEGSSISSILIQIFTRSWWSHVGIVTGSDSILEATKSGGMVDVKEVSLSEFKDNAKVVAVFHRKTNLENSALEKLSIKSNELRASKYAVEQALFSNYAPAMKVLLLLYFGYPIFLTFQYLAKSSVAGAGFIEGFKLLGGILLFWITIRILLTSTFNSSWGVSTMERLYKKNRWGRCLLKRQNDTFCSKLVATIESEIGGELVSNKRSADSYRPVDIVLACQDLNWESTYFRQFESRSIIRRLLSFWLRG